MAEMCELPRKMEAAAQNMYFNANCRCLGLLVVLVIWPPEELSIFVLLGIEKYAELGTLKASKRNCNLEPSVTLKFLNRDISTSSSLPPRQISVPESPKV